MTTHYRAWCLSWDDDDEAGHDLVGYDVMTHDYHSEVRGTIYVPYGSLSSPSDAARAYADYVHRQRDGWDSSWPLNFRVRCPDGKLLDFEVEREFLPEFRVAPLKPSRAVSK